MNLNYQLYVNQLLLQIKSFHGYQKFGGIIHVLPKNVFIILLKNSGLLNSIENTNIDNIEIPNELLINNSIVENYDEIIKKYNVNLADDKKNQTLDKFLINLNTSSTIDTFSLTNNMTNNEELEDLSDFGESDFSSEAEDDEEDNIFSTNEFIAGK